ncbi:MAG: PH domain-containing protein [Gammaproteobacteria bacterium]|nr:hypothetical protein [Gammaproteobacteria bacterium]
MAFCLVIAAILWHMRESGGVVVAVAMCIGILTSVGTAALMAWFYIGQIRASVEIGAEQLVLNIPLYARAVPIQRIRADEAERISLIGDDSRRPSVRTNGLGLPGLNLGWFRTRGGERALVAITTPDVVVVPTQDDYILIVSVADPEGFLLSLREAKQRAAGAKRAGCAVRSDSALFGLAYTSRELQPRQADARLRHLATPSLWRLLEESYY